MPFLTDQPYTERTTALSDAFTLLGAAWHCTDLVALECWQDTDALAYRVLCRLYDAYEVS